MDLKVGIGLKTRRVRLKHVDKGKKQIHYKRDLLQVISEQTGNLNISDFVDDQINLRADERILLSVGSKTYLKDKNIDDLRAFVNLSPLNKVQNINNHLFAVQKLLPDAGLFIGCVETYTERKIKIQTRYKEYWRVLYGIDFIFNRVIPRIKFLDKAYTYITKDKIHLLSKAEIFGRLVYSGFDIIDSKVIDGLMYFVAMNTHEPINTSPSFHPLIKLNRVGRYGKLMGVYKLRTMHPYSEFLQNYIVKMNGYNEVGKPANDFRIAAWAAFMRKLWLDEIPQVLNVLSFNMAIVGVRPLSRTRFKELPLDVQKERIKYKPGCIPPYVALNMPDAKGNIEAERIYFKDKKAHPYTTDIKYFFMGIKNILLGKIHSA